MTTRQDLRNWFKEGLVGKYTHMIIVCDTFSYEDYPVFVGKNQNIREEVLKRDGINMQKIMEIYDLAKDMESQISQERIFNY